MDIVSLIRFIATILITNSHYDDLYPQGYSFLSTGGMIGNALFFWVSGYTLYFSLKKVNGGGNSVYWFLRRFLRIYPSLWIFLLFLSCIGSTVKWQDFFVSTYWFINAIVICYVLYFFYIRFFSKYGKYIFILTGLTLVAYFAAFTWWGNLDGILIESPEYVSFRWFYLFQIMLLGGYCASSRNCVLSRKRDWLWFATFLITYYAYKGICIRYDVYWGQLLIPIFLMGTIFYAYKSLLGICKQGNRVYSFLQKHGKPLVFISTLTLDIYLVQFVVIKFFADYKFPIGFIGATITIFIGALILNKLSHLFYDKAMAFIQKTMFSKNVSK